MLRLLGILALGNLFFGRHHHRRRRALRRGLFLGTILGYFSGRNFNADRLEKDIRETAGDMKKAVRKIIRTVEKEIRNAGEKNGWDANGGTISEEMHAGRENEDIAVIPVSNEAIANKELVEDLERDARTAAMAGDVPTIQFPEEEAGFDVPRKYEHM